MAGRDALKITWDDGPNKTHESKAYRAQLEAAVTKEGKVERNVGDVDKALASAAKVITPSTTRRTCIMPPWSRPRLWHA